MLSKAHSKVDSVLKQIVQQEILEGQHWKTTCCGNREPEQAVSVHGSEVFPKHPGWAATAAEPTRRESSGRRSSSCQEEELKKAERAASSRGLRFGTPSKRKTAVTNNVRQRNNWTVAQPPLPNTWEQQVHLAMMTEQFLKSQSGELVQEWKKRACKKQLNAKNMS